MWSEWVNISYLITEDGMERGGKNWLELKQVILYTAQLYFRKSQPTCINSAIIDINIKVLILMN